MDPIARDLAAVEAPIRDEARDPALVMGLDTDDIVLGMPTRGLTLTGRAAIEANDRAMFGAMAEAGIAPGTRFATAGQVVDDCTVRFRLIGEGVANAPLPVGSLVEMRLLHLFAMRWGPHRAGDGL